MARLRGSVGAVRGREQAFADRPHAPAAEMVNIIERALTAAQVDQIFDRSDEISVSQNTLAQFHIDAELLIDFVTTDPPQVVLLGIEEQALQQSSRVGHRWWISRTQAPIDVLERFLLIVRGIFLQRFHHRIVG